MFFSEKWLPIFIIFSDILCSNFELIPIKFKFLMNF